MVVTALVHKLVQACVSACVKGECFTLTIKAYAKESGVTYEAVRQQIKRYSEELEGHIHLQGRTQYLDDEAIAFLDQHHLDRPIIVSEAGYDRAMRELEDTIAQLKADNEDLLERLTKASEKVAELADWKAEKAMEIAEATQTAKLLDAAKDDLDQARQDAAAANQRADALTRELVKIANMGKIKKMLYKPQIENE